MKVPEDHVFASGIYVVEAAQAADGTYPALEYLKTLDTSDRAKMQTLFDYIKDSGQIKNKEKFKKIEGSDDLFEFKNHQIRMPCFFGSDRRIYVTHGFRKKQDKIPKAEITRAEEIRDAHRARTSGGRR